MIFVVLIKSNAIVLEIIDKWKILYSRMLTIVGERERSNSWANGVETKPELAVCMMQLTACMNALTACMNVLTA